MELGMEQKGSFDGIEKWLHKVAASTPTAQMNAVGKEGVSRLAQATPVDTGLTATGWNYKVEKVKGGYKIGWFNNAHPETDANIVALLKYGHGTKNGGYVPPNNFITPAIKSVLDTGMNAYTKGVVRDG